MPAPDSPDSPPVAQALTALGISHRVFRHPGPVHSLEQAAAERGQTPDHVVRSLLFRTGEGEYVMTLMAVPGQVSWRALRRYLGRSRLTTADEAELLAVTGYPIGAVAPFGLRQPVRVLLDHSVLAQDEISLGSGVRGTAVTLRADDLRRGLPAAEGGNFQEVGSFQDAKQTPPMRRLPRALGICLRHSLPCSAIIACKTRLTATYEHCFTDQRHSQRTRPRHLPPRRTMVRRSL